MRLVNVKKNNMRKVYGYTNLQTHTRIRVQKKKISLFAVLISQTL